MKGIPADLPNIKVNKLEFIEGFQGEQVKRSGIYNFNSGNMTRDMYIKTFKSKCSKSRLKSNRQGRNEHLIIGSHMQESVGFLS